MEKVSDFRGLVADADQCILQLEDAKLLKSNLRITKASRPEEFSKIIKNNNFDFIIFHLNEESFSIDQLILLINSIKNKSIPIILIYAGQLSSDQVSNLFNAGVTEIIPGRVSDQLLIKKINIYSDIARKDEINLKLRKELSNEISEHITNIIDLRKSNQLISKRNDELNCLNAISTFNKDGLSLDAFLKQIIEIITPAFQYPAYASIEIIYDGKNYRSKKFKESRFALHEEIQFKDSTFGRISIFYDEKTERFSKHPFLEEEKQLLVTIASNLGHKIYRKKIDKQLNIFRRAIDQSSLMILISNIKSKKIEYINPKYSEISGYYFDDLKENNPLVATDDKKLISIIENMKSSVLNGKTWSGTYQTKTKDGKLFWQRSSLYPLKEKGETTHVLSIGEDISSEIELEEKLRISKENYEHISQNVPGGVFIINKKGRIVYANKKGGEILGYSNSELLNTKISDYTFSEEVKVVAKILRSGIDGINLDNTHESKIITRNGETKIIEISGTITKWKEENVGLVVINDITEKKRFSELLKIQNEIDYMSTISVGLNQSFKQIFETLFKFEWIDSGGIYLMNENRDALTLAYSKGLSEKFKTETRIYAKGSMQFEMIEQKTTIYLNSEELEPMPKVLMEEGLKSLIVIPLIHSNKTVGALNLASKLRTELSENEKLIFEAIATRIAQMITLIITQKELQFKNQRLQETLKDVREKQQLLIQKSKLESLGEMAAGVAHEINQPLGIISLSLENILYKVSSKNASPKYLKDKFDSIFNNIEKIDEIINHIRTFSRDQKSIIIERIDINEIVREAHSLINEQYTFHNISINLDLTGQIGLTLGNNHKLEQVIYNLFSNSKYALEERESSIMDISFSKKINIRSYSSNDKIYLEFEDNGIGIPTDKLNNVFNPFFTTKPEGDGTGLGLSIVYGIISEMNGTIKIESKSNEYTIVKIELPKHIRELPLLN